MFGSIKYYYYLCYTNKQNMRPHYKNIEEALKVERPTDKIIKILSNKFAVVKCMYTDGTYERESHIMSIGKGTNVTSVGYLKNMISWCKHVQTYPNVQPIGWYLINPQTKRNYYKVIWTDYRKYKHDYRRLLKLL